MRTEQTSPLSFHSRITLLVALLFVCFAGGAAPALAQISTAGTGVVRHGTTLSGSNRVEGSLQILTGENTSFGGSAVMTGSLLVPGTPAIQFDGNPNYGGTLQGTGNALPSNYQITGNGNFSLNHVVLRTNPVSLPVVPAPPLPAGTRDVTLSSAGTSPGSFSTIRNLTVSGSAGNVAIPPGTYGSFSVTGKNSLTLGIAGATQPSIYNFQQLAFSGNDDLRIVGPVVITVNGSVTCGGRVGSSANPGWLKLRLATGDLVLSGNNTLYAEIVVPNGLVRFNGNSELIGGLACDRLVLNGNNLLRFLVLNSPPAASNQIVTTAEDSAAPIVLAGTDPENNPLTYALLSAPGHGALSGTAPNLTYTPDLNYHGSDSFTFRVNDGQVDSNVATVSIAVTAVNDVPVANGQTLTTEEDASLAIVLSGQDVDGDSLRYRIVSGPAHGTLSGTLPQLTYIPTRDFNGTDRLTFVVNDGTVDSTAATVTIGVGPVNDPPVAVDWAVETDEDTALPLILGAIDPDGDAVTFRIVGAPQHGTLSGNPPNLIYTPAPNYYGTDAFTFRVKDSLEDSALATVTVTVRPVDDPPTATEQNLRGTEDTPRPIVLTGADVDGDALGFAVVLPPAHGVLTGTPPNLTYTPALDYNGPDSFTFRTADGFEVSEVATIAITIEPANDAPKANAQELVTQEDTSLPIVLSAIDVDGDALTYTIVQPPQHGALSGTAPNLTYTPESNYHETDSFVFRTSDGHASSNEALIQIQVTPVNDAPVADGQSITTEEDTPREVVLTGSDVDGDILNFRIVSGPSHGLLGGGAPQLTYTPASNYNGADAFTFVVNDGAGDSAPATVSVSVGPVNDAPVTYNQNVATDEDTPLQIPLWADEYDGDPLTFAISSPPHHGTLSGTLPDLTYTPAADYHGPDSFAFKANDGLEDSNVSVVIITVGSVNDNPVALAQHRLTPEDSPLTIALTSTDIDGDPISYAVVTPPVHGSLSGTPPNLTYSPAANFNGEDAFVFRANDGSADSAPATVSITVQPVNDLPVAAPQTIATDEEVPVVVNLTGSDVDNDSLSFLVITPPEHGTLSGTPPQLVYSPTADYDGPDRIVFAVNDGTSDSLPAEVQITVRRVNDAPAAQGQSVSTAEDTALYLTLGGTDADNDPLSYGVTTPPQHGTLSGTPPDVVYTPAADYNGPDHFAFTVNDGTLNSAEAVVQIAVSAVNDAPVATAQGVITDQNTPKAITLTGADVDPDALTFSLLTQPAHGAISGSAPNLTYTPADNYHGTDNFTFRVNDGAIDSAPATVGITVNRVNHRPIASDQSLTTAEDTPSVITLTAADPDGDPLTYAVTSNPAHGRLIGSGATLTYRPNANFSGADSFSFKANDGVIDSLPAVITITISSVNDAPVANGQTIATKKDESRAFVLTATDPDGDNLSYTVVDVPSHGTLSGAAPNLTYTPASGYLGSDRITFKVSDGTLESTVATVSINVNSNNTAPSSLPQSVATDEDHAVNITLTANDADGNTLSYTVTSQPTHGVLTGSAPALVYTPAENYNGSDHFTFAASDGSLSSDPANVAISVRPVNDAPTAEAQSIRTKQGQGKDFVLVAHDIDGDALTYTVTTQPTHGSITGAAPNLTYTPNADYYGADSLKFSVSDGQATSNEATVAIKVTPPILGRTYTTTADFAEGNLFNVSSSIPDQLQTSIDQSNFDFVWIPVFTKGTVVRLDTETGRVLGEYRLTPDDVGDPYASRTAIDSKGNCWIANERTNTVVMIANPNGADWIDKNHNGKLDTSTGQNDVKPWPNPGGVNTNGGVSAAEDELIVRYVKSTATNLRHVSVDAQDNLWVGGVGVQNFDLIDHNTGTIIRTEPSNGRGGNGGMVDFDNVLWSTGNFLRWPVGNPLSSVLPTPWNLPDNSWGVAKDPFGNTWVTFDPSTVVYKYGPDGHLIDAYPHGYTWSQGIAIDANGDVWIATSHCGYAIAHLKNDGTLLGSVPVAEHGPTGVAVDRKGRIWASSTTGIVQRINPLGGPIGSDGVTPVGEVDISSTYLGGTVWAYSNFTGAALARAGQRGRWTVTYDSEQDGANWGPVVWNAQICNDGGLPVFVSLSDDGVHYSPEQLLTPEQSVPSGTGRFITVRVDFEPAENGGTSPILQDITVGTQGYVPPAVAHGWSVTAGNDINANWPDPIVLHGAICRSAYDPVVNSTLTWSLLSGPGQVSFSDIHAIQPTCQFTKDGTYVFRVTAAANGVTQSDDVTVRLTPYNKAPWVSAGPNTSIRTIDETVSLNGTVRDDGLPENTPVQIHWSKKFGPGTVTFANPAQAQTTATFSTPGIYILELSATDTQYSASAIVEIRISAFCNIGRINDSVSWWQANGTAADHISGNEAFLEKGATYADGKVGAAFKFDGVDDRAIVFRSPSLDVAKNGSMTIEFWANTTDRDQWPLLLGWNNGTRWGVRMEERQDYWNSNLYASLIDTAGVQHEFAAYQQYLRDGTGTGQWHHYALTYDKATGLGRLYVNGVLQVQTYLGSFTPQTSYDLYFGHVRDQSAPLAGMLDEVSIYSRALDGQEIWEIYAADADGKCPINENAAPAVSAGPEQSIAENSGTTTLLGSVSDDGLPQGSTVVVQWAKLSGPGSVSFASPNSVQTAATFSAPGIYVLSLTADDTLERASDTVEVRVGSFCTVDSPVGLAAWWPGQGNAREAVASNDGRLLNGTRFAEAKTSLGFKFDGNDDGVRVPAAPRLDIAKTGDGSLTIEFWANTTDRDQWPLLVGWNNGTRWGVRMEERQDYWNSNLYASLIDTAGVEHEFAAYQQYLRDGTGTGQWHHYALTYDKPSGIAKLYVNGILQLQSKLGSFTPQTSYDIYFGNVQGFSPSSNAITGMLDEVSLYSRALDGQEIYDIFAADKAGKCPVDANQAPTVSAGADQSTAQNNGTVTVTGSVTDDGLPAGSSISVLWTKLSGPGAVSFGTPGSLQTTATFTAPGIYVLQLTANDTLDRASDTVEVRVGAFCEIETPVAGLAAWWPAQGNGRETIAQSDGRLLNGLGFSPGKVSLGFNFDGADDGVRVPATSGTDIAKSGDGSLTIEFWSNSTDRDQWPLLVGWNNGTKWGVRMEERQDYWNSNLYASLVDTAGVEHEFAAYQQSLRDGTGTGQWRHYALTYDRANGIAKLYINGILQLQNKLGSFTPQTGYDVYFGNVQGFSSSSNAFAGILDEIGFYNRALDGKEIYDLFASGTDGKCPLDSNRAPVVDAGPNQSVAETGRAITLYGVVTDDGMPAGSTVALRWTQIDGPGQTTFGDATAAQTSASFNLPGIYVLQLTANDSLNAAADTVEVRVDAICTIDNTRGLAAWWPGNGNATDVINQQTGRLLNGAGFKAGKVSMGFNFDGIDDGVRMPAAANTDVAKAGDGSLTIEFWANTTDRDQWPLLLGWNNGTKWGVRLEERQDYWNSNLYASLVDTAGVEHEFAAYQQYLRDGTGTAQWHHYALTYDKPSGIAKLYVNGILQLQTHLGSFTPQTGYDLYFGNVQSFSSQSNALTGVLDEVSLYSRALDGNEIHDLYAAGTDGKCPIDDNAAPVVNAGPDQSIPQVTGVASLQGSVVDDGLPAGAVVVAEWSKIAGPGEATFANPNAAQTTATFSLPGIYVLKLLGHDGLDEASDTVEVRVAEFCRVDSPANLAAWWPGNGNAADAVSGNIARLLNGTTFGAGKVSAAFNFDGNDDGVRVPAAPRLDIAKTGDGSLTIEFWANTTDRDQWPLLVGWNNGTRWGVRMEERQDYWNSNLYASLIDTAGVEHEFAAYQQYLRDGTGTGQWHHYALTYDKPSGIAKLYVNGILQLQSKLGSFTPQTSYDIYFGNVQGFSSGSNAITGMLDEVSLYSRALDGQEIYDIFAADKAGKCPVDANQAPAVNAGPDQAIPQQTGIASLAGKVSDDGFPLGATLATRWSKMDGPGDVVFANPDALQTTATFTASGIYVLQLTADDSLDKASDTLEIRVGSPCTVEAAPGLAAWWPANGSGTDVISGQTSRLLNGVNFGKGKVSLGFNFDGVNDGVRVPAATNLDIAKTGNGSLTIEFWANSTDRDQWPLLVGWNNGSRWGVRMEERQDYWNSNLYASLIDTAGVEHEFAAYQQYLRDGTGTGQWHHYALTYDKASGIGKLYVNGTLQVQTPLGSFTPQTGYDLYFGYVQDQSAPLSGVLDEISLYSRALTAQEIQAVYAAAACGKTPFVRNTPPTVNAGYDRTITLPTNSVTLTGTAVDDGLPANSSVTTIWTQTAGPAAAGFSHPATLQTSVTFTQVGDYTFQLSASDGALTAAATVHVTVLPDLRTPPTVSLTAPSEGSRFQSTQTITLAAYAVDNDGRISKVEFFANGAKLGEKLAAPYSFAWNNAPGGAQALTATATDNDGLTATSGPVNIEVVDTSSAPPPKVELTSPEDASVVTAPTEVRGSVEMAALKSWRLEYQLQGTPCAEWITFATGTGQVHDNVLGTLDPTLLLNGTYSVRLVVTDLANVSQTPNYLTFFIDGNMKVGQFSATFKDLELPLAGVPIAVTRTYDSRNHCPGDFGYGWTLDVDSLRLESTEQMGDAWSQFIFVGNLLDPSYYRLDDAGPHLVSVKMPDGKLLRFTPKLVMDRPYSRLLSLLDQDGDDIGQMLGPIRTVDPLKVIYRARPGAEGAVLKPRGYRTDDGGIIAENTPLFLEDTFEGAIRLATRPAEFFEAPVMTDVTGWELTLRDGRVLLFDKEGKLEEMRDRVGNKVAFNRDGQGKIQRITHTPSGKEIVFTRDGSNRIQSITDPAGNKVQYRYTSNGDLEKVFERGNDPTANVPNTRFTYKGVTHLLEDILDARGIRAARNFYDDAGRLFKTIDADGKETIFTHDLNTRTETIKDRAGNTTVHRYDERGNIIETRSPDGTVTTTGYHRWSDGTLSDLKETESVTGLFTDPTIPTSPLSTRTLTTHYSYEDDDASTPPANDGLLRKLVDPMGHTTSITYDERGNVLTVTDANANGGTGTPAASVTNTYYANGQLQTATDALGHVTTFTYDAKGNPDTETRTVTLTNADGSSSLVNVVTDRDYNTVGQLEKLTDPDGHVTTYEYDLNGNRRFERTTRTDGNATVAVVTETEYDEQDRPVRSWNADNPRAQATRPSSRTVYDDNGRVAWTYDALGHGTHQEYDSRGLLFKTTHPDNKFETVTYDAEGRREIATDRRGMATKTVYDLMGRVQNTIFLGDSTYPAVTLSTTAYDAAGRVWQSTDANGHTTSYSYDAAGRRTAVTQPLLQNATISFMTRYTYDNNGNLRVVTDAKGRPTEHVYDALNRRIQTILPAGPIDLNGDGLLGTNENSVITSTQTSYDELGRRVSETDASNRTKRYGYDVLGHLRHVIDFAGQATRFGYDELGNQLSQTDANNHTTGYTYDNAGRRVTRTLPLGQQELLGYDDAGNLTSRKDFNGRVTTFGYDAMNRLRYRVPDPSLAEPTIEFTYTPNGQRETMRDATGTTIYDYDGRGQLSTKQTPFGTVSYSYYPNGSLKQLWSSNANGVNTSYSYDNLNRLEIVTDPDLGNTSYTYDEVGNLKSANYPNAIKHQYTYNALNRLDLLIDRSPTNTIINCWKYHATGAGQRTWVEEFDHRTAWYTYDTLGRLKTETVTGSIQDGKNGTVTYGYDNVGNRLGRTSSLSGVINQAFGYDANDRLNGDQYDNNGNTTSSSRIADPASRILGVDSYDSENRLTQRTGTTGSNVTLVYDGDGNRVQEIVNGQTKSYLIDDRNPTGYAQVVEEIVNGSVNHTYTYGHDLISQDQVDPANNTWHATFYAYDGHGNVRFLTNESGQVTDTYVYDAFGTLITATGSTNNRYLYTGEQFDPNLGLYYLRARLLNPLTGRFWSADSYDGENSDPISLHKYLYGNADPVGQIDPSGNWSSVESAVTNSIASSVMSMQLDSGRSMLRQSRGYLSDDGNLIDDALFVADLAQLANDIFFSINAGRLLGQGSATLIENFALRASRTTGPGLTPALRALSEANITQSGKTVLGHYDTGYIEKAQRIGASYFNVAEDVWKTLTPAEQTIANRHFLDEIAAAGDQVYLSVTKTKIRAGSALADEIQYLTTEKGYTWINQWSLRPPGK
jgi:RHS repeat-associated protein